MADAASVDPDDLRRLAVALKAADRRISSAVETLRRTLNAAHWDDAQRRSFESVFRDMARVSKEFTATATGAEVALRQKAENLDAYNRG